MAILTVTILSKAAIRQKDYKNKNNVFSTKIVMTKENKLEMIKNKAVIRKKNSVKNNSERMFPTRSPGAHTILRMTIICP